VTNKPKAKGRAEEHRIAELLNGVHGWTARRVPGSGMLPGLPAGDVVLESPDGHRFLVESKKRASGAGFKTLRRWLGKKDILWLREDHARGGMVVIEQKAFLELLEHWVAGVAPGEENQENG